MNKERQELILEVIQIFESAAKYNNKMFRTILAYDQQQIADRLKQSFSLHSQNSDIQ